MIKSLFRCSLFLPAALLLWAPSAWSQAVPSDEADIQIGSNNGWGWWGYNNNGSGSNNNLRVQYQANGQGANQSWEAFINFNMSVFPPNLTPATIEKATLVLYVQGGGNAGTVTICQVLQSWSSATISGMNAPTCSNTATATLSISATQVQQGGFVTADVTTIVQNWYNGAGNFGIMLAAAAPPSGTRSGVSVQFDSLEQTNGYPVLLDLVIQNQGPQGPTGPQGPQGPPGSTANVTQLQTQVNNLQQQVTNLQGTVQNLQQSLSSTIQNALQNLAPLTLNVNCANGQTVSAALQGAQNYPGSVIVNITGTCVEQVNISRNNVALNGAAPGAGVAAQSSSQFGLININGMQINVNNLTLAGGGAGNGLTVNSGSVSASNLDISGTSNFGVSVNSGVLNLSSSNIHGNTATGVGVGQGGTLNMSNSTVTGSGAMGVYVYTGGITVLQQMIITNNGWQGVQLFNGIANINGGTIQGNAQGGVMLLSESGAVLMGGTVVSGNSQIGVTALDTSSITLRDVTIQNNQGDGVGVTAGSSVLVGSSPTPTVIQNNSGNGITALDTSIVGNYGTVNITGNTGWGVFCQPSPGVAQLQAGPPLSSVTGNTQGQISCPAN